MRNDGSGERFGPDQNIDSGRTNQYANGRATNRDARRLIQRKQWFRRQFGQTKGVSDPQPALSGLLIRSTESQRQAGNHCRPRGGGNGV